VDISILDNFRKGIYDLLILDVVMPKMHGFELYREIGSIDSEVQICFITAGEICYAAYSDIFAGTLLSISTSLPQLNDLMQTVIKFIVQRGVLVLVGH
jgi:two-component SAPR family response regulator